MHTTPSTASSSGLRGLVSRGRARWLWQPDKWDRLTTVSDLLGRPSGAVADVGGRGQELPWPARGALGGLRQRRAARATCWSRRARSPSWTTPSTRSRSCDVLEHLPAGQTVRATSHELVRVARTRVVLCFPAGSDAKDASERRLADRLATRRTTCVSTSSRSTSSTVSPGWPTWSPTVEGRCTRRVGAGRLPGRRARGRAAADGGRRTRSRVGARRPCSAPRVPGWYAVDRRSCPRPSPDNNRAYVVIDLAPPAPR